MMDFVCLVSGYGTRMRPLTNYLKKEMYPILDRPFVAYSLGNLREFTDEVIVLVGPKKEQVKSYFGENWNGLKIKYVEQMDPLGTGDALLKVYEKYGIENFITWLGDVYVSDQMFEKLIASEKSNLLSFKKVDYTYIPHSPLEMDHLLRVTRAWGGKSFFAHTGIFKLNSSIFNYINGVEGEVRLLKIVQNSIEDGNLFYGIESDIWFDLDMRGNLMKNREAYQLYLSEMMNYFMEQRKNG